MYDFIIEYFYILHLYIFFKFFKFYIKFFRFGLSLLYKAMVRCKHHCFLSEVPDVRHMEQALLQLLEDFHSGNLRAFG
jgi:hypothetical protein